MIELHTERLRLRMFREADIDEYARIVGDAETMRYIGKGEPLTLPEAWKNIAAILGHWQMRGYGFWAAEEKSTGKFAGALGCSYPAGWPGFEVGWTLAREFRGRGLATEGARAALRYSFEKLEQSRVISLIQPGNDPSIAVAERIGESLAGRTVVGGKECLIYAIERAEWERTR